MIQRLLEISSLVPLPFLNPAWISGSSWFTYYWSLVLVAQSCPTLCDPMDCSPPGSSVHEIFQARILEWVAISFSRGFPTQGSNPGLLHFRQILYWLSYKGSLAWRILSIPLLACEMSAVVWTFFGPAFLRDWNENWPFPVLWPLLSFPNLLAYWVQYFNSIIF